ncbi:hypothetical protein AKO1_011493 [Acrasis kona]|uniref:F-box domain-containing protein n=1 Tax=Acrasis kona TaxID=1008807 RepID=A0AAW2Z2Z6_9EUKA
MNTLYEPTPDVIWIKKDDDIVPVSVVSRSPKLVLSSMINDDSSMYAMNGTVPIPREVLLHVFSFMQVEDLLLPEIMLSSKFMYNTLTSSDGVEFIQNTFHKYKQANDYIRASLLLLSIARYYYNPSCLFVSINLRHRRMCKIWVDLGNYVPVRSRVDIGPPCQTKCLEELKNELCRFYKNPKLTIPTDIVLSWCVHDGEIGDAVLQVSSLCPEISCILGFAKLLTINEIVNLLKVRDPKEYTRVSPLDYKSPLYLLPISDYVANKELCIDIETGVVYLSSGWNLFAKADNLLEYYYTLLDIPLIPKNQINELPQIL